MKDYGLLVHHTGGSEWLTFYDPDGGPPEVHYPTGTIETSVDPKKALRFESPAEAMEFWRQVGTRTPIRPDGRPNRPLTAHTISVLKIK